MYNVRLIANDLPVIEIENSNYPVPLHIKMVPSYSLYKTVRHGVYFNIAHADNPNPAWNGTLNAFNFKFLLQSVANAVDPQWQPKEDGNMPPFMAYQWKRKKTARILTKRLLEAWRNALSIGKETISHYPMAKRQFLITQSQEGHDLRDFEDVHILADYERFGASVWFYHLFITGHYTLWDVVNNIYGFAGLNYVAYVNTNYTHEQRNIILRNWRGILAAYHDKAFKSYENYYGREPATPNFPTKVYRALNATLSNMPSMAIPQDAITAFWDIQPKFPRPLLSRRELLWAMLCPDKQEDRLTSHRFNYDKKQIADGMRWYAENIVMEKRSPDKSVHISELWQFIIDGMNPQGYPPEENAANFVTSATSLVSLVKRSQEAHENERRRALEREKERAKAYAALDSYVAPEPPVLLPVSKDGVLKQLRVASDFHNEGIKMGHCIAGSHYILRAMKGEAFYIHGEYQGIPFTAEIFADGRIAQIRGIRNQMNKATEWGEKVLGRWAKKLAGKPFTAVKLVAMPGLDELEDGILF